MPVTAPRSAPRRPPAPRASRLARGLRGATLACAFLAACGGAGGVGGDEAGTDGTAREARPASYRGVQLATPIEMPAATLEATDGASYDLRAETRGKVALLFFGYTRCPDVCPVHMANLAAVLADLGWDARDRIEVVFVTTDPARDTPERIRAWLDRFSPAFVGLRGAPGDVADLQGRLNLAASVRQPDPDGEGYLVGHASQVVAFTADGMARVVYPFGTRQADWRHDLPLLLAAGPEPPPATAAR